MKLPVFPAIKDYNGPFTAELVQSPADFGLGQLPARMLPVATTTSICGYCATGCQLQIHLDSNGQAINLTPAVGYPVNLGMACPKGWQALDVLASTNRGTVPLLRNAGNQSQEPISWGDAADLFCQKLKSIKAKHGSESVAFLSTGQIPFEEMAFLGCLFKFGMGFVHADANTRQCMATAATAYKQAYGFDAPGYSYDDFEESDVIVLVGSNLCIAHPILWQRVMRNKRNPKIIVIDPRCTETAMCATHFMQIKPKGDLALFQALAHCLIRDDAIDHDFILNHTEGFEEYSREMLDLSPVALHEVIGLDVAQIEELAQWISEVGKRVSYWWTMGINQSHEGVRAAQAIIALCLMTGNIGKPGTGANSITGQCNAMGSRIFSNTTTLVGGYDFTNADHRAIVAERLEMDLDCIPSENSLAYDQILDAVDAGRIKALWVIATNPFHSWIDSSKMERLRSKLEFLVVQDMYLNSETARLADLYLPAAGWGEKDGCFINSERRIGSIKQVSKPPGQALSDFRIFRLLAHAWGCAEMFRKWESPEAVFRLLAGLTVGRPCDISGISGYEMIDARGGVPWPCAMGQTAGTKRLFSDGKFYTANGKAKFVYSPTTPAEDLVDGEYPFFLITGRGTSSQWHTMTRTNESAILRKLSPARPQLEMHGDDIKKLGLCDHQEVIVRSRRGEIRAIVYAAPTVRVGEVFLPMHYAEVNRLTHPSVDPHSRQPSYKATAVQIVAPT